MLAVELHGLVARAEASPGSGSVEPASELVAATVSRFARLLKPEATAAAADIRWETAIPRSVGLGGSSAIVIATTRALCAAFGVELERSALAEFALAVEVEELGIAAGLQDRVAQAYGGLTFMDFGSPDRHYESLEPELLPPLLIAWQAASGAHSGLVHGDLRTRFEAGEPGVTEAMIDLGRHARTARAALIAGDHATFARCVDASFDARDRMLVLDPRHVEMVRCARAAGAWANYTGSGGAIVAVSRDPAHREQVAAALEARACRVRAL